MTYRDQFIEALLVTIMDECSESDIGPCYYCELGRYQREPSLAYAEQTCTFGEADCEFSGIEDNIRSFLESVL